MENYSLEKEYKITPEIFEKGYRAFQKKYVYPKGILFAVIFLVLTVDFVCAAVKDPSNYFTYVLVFTCLAFAIRELSNPSRIRNRYIDTVEEMGEVVYKIGVSDNYVDISTVSVPEILQDPEEVYEETDIAEEVEEDTPETSRITVDENFRIAEYDEFFLIFYGKEVFYILPKEGFSESEINIIKKIKAD